ncbi:gliding motility-associated C-terminal domain-containing protein [Paenimyroides ummariense]|uniref:Gliding motility-associated C-terminal domain-containing protein n=1 Tax=Paenimyroides ummariense TaxID=913024 RepID=A0A1I4X4G8_9FLAO|nr:gliding motility-associated C-terminal domain-containing protein [Paenimyroides ummariense]SFN20552.1 gliding motility-associated C-terminal domain-containing protein [Paenimyroides ummariense]
MFKKILFFLLLANVSMYAQKTQPDYECFNIDISEIDVDTRFLRDEDDPDFYIVCKNKKIGVTPNFQTQYLRRTDVYQVEPLAHNPYPTDPTINGGTELSHPTWDFYDCRTDCPIQLPFKFCYFNQVYEHIFVWSNGAVTFTPNGNCSPSTYHSFMDEVFTGPLPNGLVNNNFLNSIFGSYQHTHFSKANYPTGSVNYQVYGTAPCRKFVISFHNMPAAGLFPTNCPPPVPLQSHQIVLHELTNVIDVNIIQHDNCPSNDPIESSAVIGIINITNTQGYSPPNRNVGSWAATNESWRFAPAGECMYDTQWTVTDIDGTVVHTELDDCEGELDIIVDEYKEVTATLIVNTCVDTYTESYKIRLRPAIEIDQVDLQPIVCDKNQNTYDLNLLTRAIKDGQSASQAEINKLRFYYYETEFDADNKENEIKNIREYPIKEIENPLYIRIEYSGLEECPEIIEAMIIKAPVEVLPKTDVYICTEYKLPVLTNDEFYLKMERLDEDANFVVETMTNVNENQVITKHGYYRVYVKKTNKYACEDVKSYLLMVENCSYPKGITPNGDGDNDYLDLTYNNVQELKVYNRYGKLVYEHGKGYKRQWMGQDSSGKILPSGTYFLYIKTRNYEYQDWIQLMYEVK